VHEEGKTDCIALRDEVRFAVDVDGDVVLGLRFEDWEECADGWGEGDW
jgi:hypothetical protein